MQKIPILKYLERHLFDIVEYAFRYGGEVKYDVETFIQNVHHNFSKTN